MEELIRCSRCKEPLPKDAFYEIDSRSNGLSSRCKVCSRAVSKAWRENNAKHYRESLKAYRNRNSDYLKERRREYCKKNRDKINELSRSHYWRNRDKERLRGKAYAQANKERWLVKTHRRRAREAGAEGAFTQEEWLAKCEEYGNLCAYCLQPVKLTRHHVIPISKGGSNWIDNIVPACRSCNSRIGTRTINPEDRHMLEKHGVVEEGITPEEAPGKDLADHLTKRAADEVVANKRSGTGNVIGNTNALDRVDLK